MEILDGVIDYLEAREADTSANLCRQGGNQIASAPDGVQPIKLHYQYLAKFLAAAGFSQPHFTRKYPRETGYSSVVGAAGQVA